MKRRRPNWFGIKYLPPGDEIRKLMEDHWAVPFWGIRESGPTGILFILNKQADVFLSGSDSVRLDGLKLVIFNRHATKPEKRDWLADLGISALREDCSRTRESWTMDWIPLLRQGKKPFGLTKNWHFDTMSEEFSVFRIDGFAHVFGDGVTLAQRREYAKELGADVGLVEPLKGKPKEKRGF